MSIDLHIVYDRPNSLPITQSVESSMLILLQGPWWRYALN